MVFYQYKPLIMLVEVELPRLGESITEATILSFPKQVGEFVAEGETLVEIATDKVDSEVVAPCDGVIKEILAAPDDVVPIGTCVIVLDNEATGMTKAKASSRTKTQNAKPAPSTAPTAKIESASTTGTSDHQNRTIAEPLETSKGEVFLSPLVLSIAKSENLTMHDIRSIRGTGTKGRIRKSDIHQYLKDRKYPLPSGGPAAASATSKTVRHHTPFANFQPPVVSFDPKEDRIESMDRMREKIASHMVYSVQTAPHVTCYVEVDLTDIVEWRNQVKQSFLDKHGYKLTLTPIFIEAITKAIQDYPMINVALKGKDIVFKKSINIGMATAIPSGHLIVPVIHDADKKNLTGLAKEVNALSLKARTNQLDPADIQGGTFTLSNVGTFGSLTGTPIINQPQSAILATGIIKKRPEVMTYDGEDRIEIRQMMITALSFDHRVIDGYLGGSFLKKIADYLEAFQPDKSL